MSTQQPKQSLGGARRSTLCATSRRKTAKISSKYFKPEHKRAARSLGFALTSGETESWFALRDILAASLTDTELVALAYMAFQATPERAQNILLEAIAPTNDAYSRAPIAPMLGVMDAAQHWAKLTPEPELKAYLLSCFEHLPPKTQSAFLAHVSTNRPEMEVVQQ